MNRDYIEELKEFAEHVNYKLLYERKKIGFRRKLNSISKRYNKTFEEVFNDYTNARMGTLD